MSVVTMQVFVSLLLVAGSLVLFVHSVRQRDYDHADRLALAPLEDDDRDDVTRSTQTPRTKPPCKQNRSNTTTP